MHKKCFLQTSRYRLELVIAFLFVGISMGGPEISVDREVINGICTMGVDTPFTYAVKNIGDEDMVIHKVKGTCGCVHVEAEETTLSPGQETQIKGLYKTGPLRNEFMVHILVESNAVNEPFKRLTISGRNMPPDVEVNPRSLNVTCLQGETPPPETITIATAKRLLIEGISFVSPEETGDIPRDMFTISERKDQDQKLSLTISFRPSDTVETYLGQLCIKGKLGGQDSKFTIPIKFDVVPEYSFYPPEIKIYETEGQTSYSLRSLLKNRRGTPLSITSIESPSDAIRVRSKSTSSGAYFLYVDIDSTDLPRNEAMIITIRGKADDQEVTLSYPIHILNGSALFEERIGVSQEAMEGQQ
jgi:hypothetical protein